MCVQTDRLLSIMTYFACGSMVLVFSFSGTCCTLYKFFMKKNGVFPLLEARFPSWFVTAYIPLWNTSDAVCVQTDRLLSITAYFACGSMVLVFSFSGTCCTLCNMFLKKKKIFRPAGGESRRSSRQTPGLEPTAYILLCKKNRARRSHRIVVAFSVPSSARGSPTVRHADMLTDHAPNFSSRSAFAGDGGSSSTAGKRGPRPPRIQARSPNCSTGSVRQWADQSSVGTGCRL